MIVIDVVEDCEGHAAVPSGNTSDGTAAPREASDHRAVSVDELFRGPHLALYTRVVFLQARILLVAHADVSYEPGGSLSVIPNQEGQWAGAAQKPPQGLEATEEARLTKTARNSER